ncbi:Ribosomal protein L9 [sediment metagenome]|uniref:Ribosomal protein L9 n=1 Tax=sediment metagenome TaxID=749907 RepID=D9PIM1_9ZZZZ
MKIILIADVPGLGRVDDIKDVSEGYAANFLFPRHLAVLASAKAVKELTDSRRRKDKAAEHELRDLQSLASRIDGLPLQFKEKINEAGLLYAAVGPQKIVEVLNKMGLAITKSQIQMKPFKEPGEYEVVVKLKHGLEAKMNLSITPVEYKKSQNT